MLQQPENMRGENTYKIIFTNIKNIIQKSIVPNK